MNALPAGGTLTGPFGGELELLAAGAPGPRTAGRRLGCNAQRQDPTPPPPPTPHPRPRERGVSAATCAQRPRVFREASHPGPGGAGEDGSALGVNGGSPTELGGYGGNRKCPLEGNPFSPVPRPAPRFPRGGFQTSPQTRCGWLPTASPHGILQRTVKCVCSNLYTFGRRRF